MGCCCKKSNGETKREKICCVCNPFDQDGFLLTAQICSIAAACLSWVWWPLFVLSAPIVTILQTSWCCKMKKQGLAAASILSGLAFVLSFFIGIWMSVECWTTIFVVISAQDDDYRYNDYYYHDSHYDYCHRWMNNPTAWVVVVFIDCLLFLLTFVCSTYFVVYRYDSKASKWSRGRDGDDADADEVVVPVQVEMGVNPSAPQATATVLPPNEKEGV